MNNKTTYTVSEVAEIFNVHRTTVHYWINKGHIRKVVQVGDGWKRIPQSEIDRLMGDNCEND
jgi:excisionase family DNA binding protein